MVEEAQNDAGVGSVGAGLMGLSGTDIAKLFPQGKVETMGRKQLTRVLVAKALGHLPESVRKQFNYPEWDAPGSVWWEVISSAGPDYIEAAKEVDGSDAPSVKNCMMSGGSALQTLAGVVKSDQGDFRNLPEAVQTKISVVMDLLGGMLQYGMSGLAGDFYDRTRDGFLLTRNRKCVPTHRGRRMHKSSQQAAKMDVVDTGVGSKKGK